MERHEIASLEVETQPLAGQVFYILDRNAEDDTSLISADYATLTDLLRSEAVKFFVTDSQGKAEIKGLKPGIYYVCSVGKTGHGTGVWKVQIDLKPGKNSLVLDNKNMTERQNL